MISKRMLWRDPCFHYLNGYALHIELRFLPVATPELNAMDHLWRHVKGWGLANRATVSIDTSADVACHYLLDLSPRERLRKAGVLSGHFWLAL